MEKKNDFKPFISADKVLPEFTVTSVILGMILAVIFGGANAYLGLRVGMTVSASIPAAVISMGVIRVILKKDSILENNMVQTIGSAGESLAAGAIFTIPAIFIWASEKGSGVYCSIFCIYRIDRALRWYFRSTFYGTSSYSPHRRRTWGTSLS